MTLIKDLIDIPERVQKGDFVLRLAEDISHPERILDNYVLTPELQKCYDAALSFIGNSVQNRSSKATYLHGSFGSGKSHFMAVLHLILQGNVKARGIPELAPVIKKHNEWLSGKKFLLVPYHMIGAHDMESGILGNYVDFMRATHPEAPTPPVYVSAAIVEQANAERASYGDELFFKRLNEGQGSAGGWGELEAAWDADSYEQAAAAPPDSEQHLRLVSTLLKTVASSHAEVVSHRGGNFVKFDKGLSLISQHASNQGYDALILFLDELILWLATHSADLGFVKREAAKLTNLVEAQSADRPIPLVSFVARQRDLRELVGEHVPGAEKLSFSDSLDWQQGRFDTITLEDRNLPAIAQKRVLRCRSTAARDQMDAAFEKTAKMRDNVMNILLTQEGDQKMFRQVYPFSPALVQTLIAVSSMLQRERTALKVMLQLLVEHRETLELGQIIPVGDLFDVVAYGDEAFNPEMAIHFDNAQRLYEQRLRPLLETQHGIRYEDVKELPFTDPKRTAFRNDDRLIKTLLLSALVPEVESLRGLNAEKLAALNHGSIKSPIPGKEASEVLRRCRNWAVNAGEIHITEDANPSISVRLSGVDTESIIEQARREDTQGNRVRQIRQMLFRQLGIQGEQEFERYLDFSWKNTKRTCTVLFGNIRELPNSSLKNDEDDWKLIIDFPFDEPGHGPRDDISTIQRFKQNHKGGAKTICWIPSFFSAEAQRDLGMLVILEHVLTGDRYGQLSSHLSVQDRQSAKSALENQLNQLRQRVKDHLNAAYGVTSQTSGSLDTTHDLELNEHYESLFDGFVVRPPGAADLAGAMQHMLSQALEHEFPGAPDFEAEVKPGSLKKVYEQVMPATQVADGRLAIEKPMRPLVRQIAGPLKLGEMGIDATHFVLGQYWKTHFDRRAAENGGVIEVEDLRRWIDDPAPMGLPKEAQNLVILMYAAQTSQTLYQHGGPFEGTLSTIPGNCVLRKDQLPDASEWERALSRAGSLFGVTESKLLNARNVASLSTKCKDKASQAKQASQLYARELKQRIAALGVDAASADRLKTASATRELLQKLVEANAREVVHLLATAKIETSETAMGECIAKAAELEGNLQTAGWQTYELIHKLPAEHQDKADPILKELRHALASDEHVLELATELKSTHAQAMLLLERLVETKPAAPSAPAIKPQSQTNEATPVPIPTVKRKTVIDQNSEQDLTLSAARDLLADLAGKIQANQSVRVNLSWVVEQGGDS